MCAYTYVERIAHSRSSFSPEFTECGILWISELENCTAAVHQVNVTASMVATDVAAGADHDHSSMSLCGRDLMVAD